MYLDLMYLDLMCQVYRVLHIDSIYNYTKMSKKLHENFGMASISKRSQ